MRQKTVAGNWKMNMDLSTGLLLVDEIIAGTGPSGDSGARVVICPPFVLLERACERVQGTRVELGAQNLSDRPRGAFTGEISGEMLRSVGCRHVIVGHSERRTIFGETDDVVARKTVAALSAGLEPIVCVGETLEERDAGRVEDVVGRQVDAVLAAVDIGASFGRMMFAYEPVWAIGTGRTATPEQAQEVHAFMRARFGRRPGGVDTPILYGGSVNAANAAELFAQPDIDGGLIGGASLKAESFLTIVNAAG